MKKIFMSILMSMTISLSTASADDKVEPQSNPSLKHDYDLRSECGFSLSSNRKFSRGEEKCSLIYHDRMDSPFFYGSISSNKSYLSEVSLVGAIDLSGETPRSTRIDYYDDQRDVTQHQIISQQVKISTGSEKDIIIVSELEVLYDKPDESGQILTPVKETYECWDGIFYGKHTAVSLALCSLNSPKKHSFASQSSWQADVIKSLSVE